MRKWNLARIDFAPFQYDTASGQVTSVTSATAEVRFSRTGQTPSSQLMAETMFDGTVAASAVNFEAATSWYTTSADAQAQRTASVGSARATAATAQDAPACPATDPWTYVIVTTNEIKRHSTKLEAFIEHKEQTRNQYVKVVTEDDYDSLTGAAPNGRSDRIRQFLMNEFPVHQFQYVLLIGNPNPDLDADPTAISVPMKMCWPYYRPTDGGTSHTIPGDNTAQAPTDYYFSNLSSNWNKGGTADHACEYQGDYYDDNGYEYPSDDRGMSLSVDAVVGRIPVYGNNYTDLDSILQKIIDYQSSTNTAWRKSIITPMTFEAKNYDLAVVAEAVWNNYLSSQPGFTRYTLYREGPACKVQPSDDPTYIDDCRIPQRDYAPNGYTCDEALTEMSFVNRWAAHPYGIVFWQGHGNGEAVNVGWSAGKSDGAPDGGPTSDYCDCGGGDLINKDSASRFSNTQPAFVYSGSCQNAWPWDDQNLMFALLRSGAIAAVGATADVGFSLDFARGRESVSNALWTAPQVVAHVNCPQVYGPRRTPPPFPHRDPNWSALSTAGEDRSRLCEVRCGGLTSRCAQVAR